MLRLTEIKQFPQNAASQIVQLLPNDRVSREDTANGVYLSVHFVF